MDIYQPGTRVTYTRGPLGTTDTADGDRETDHTVGDHGVYVGPSRLDGFHVTHTASAAGTVVYVGVDDNMFRPTFHHPDIGYRAGHVAGDCGHAVALSEWRAGFRKCERC